MIRRRRRRELSAEERALWSQVARSVTPLRPEAPPAEAPPAPEPVPSEPAPRPVVAGPAAPAAWAPAPKPLAALEPKTRRRLVRGAEVDARLDLHGLTQAAAHRRLRGFVVEAQAQGFAVVLVITGKGGGSLPDAPVLGEGRGVLRRAVPQWLAEADLRPFVLGFEEAGRRHGGEGALYVRIRRRRD